MFWCHHDAIVKVILKIFCESDPLYEVFLICMTNGKR